MRDLLKRPDLLCINTGTLGYKDDIYTIIKALGKRSIGYISPWRRELEGRKPQEIKKVLEGEGVQVNCLCRSTFYTADTPQKRKAACEENYRALDLAAALGAKCYVQVVGSLLPGQKDLLYARAQVEDGIAALLEHSKDVGIPMAIEPLHPMTCADRSCITTLREALDLCDRLDPDHSYALGVAVDVYHIWWDAFVAEQIARAGKRILTFHTSDWLVDTKDLVNDRGMPGDGCIDIKGLRKQVEETGFLGPVELEVFSSENWWKKDLEEILDTAVSRMAEFC